MILPPSDSDNPMYKRPVHQAVKDYNIAFQASRIIGEVHCEPAYISWKPPPQGWVKMNSDGSWRCSAYVAKFWGVLEGLKLAKRLGFQAIEVNVDSILVANIINNNKEGSPTGRDLVRKICSLVSMDWEIMVRHSYCEAN
ncbi:ribonuclease H protein, partial [Trifolium medium]|nr:ribonuclease H protein [Trifolium medium]